MRKQCWEIHEENPGTNETRPHESHRKRSTIKEKYAEYLRGRARGRGGFFRRQMTSALPPRPTVDVTFTVGPWLNRVAQHGPCRTIQGLDSARRGFRTYTRRNARRKWKCVTCERPTTASGCTYCGPLCGACAKTCKWFIPSEGGADPGAKTWVPKAPLILKPKPTL